MYAVDGSGLGNRIFVPTSLYIIDPSDGSFELLGELGVGYEHAVGIAACPLSSKLYAINNGGDDNATLLMLDPHTGAATHIGYTGHQITDLAFAPDGTLYGWAEFSATSHMTDFLVTINTETGLATALADFVEGTQQSGVAVDHNGTIWMKRNTGGPSPKNFLHRLTSSGLDDTSVEMSARTDNMLAYSPDGMLYTGERGPGVSSIRIIDPATGTVSTLSETAIPRLAGFTFRCETGPTGGAAVGAIIGIVIGFLLLLCCCWWCSAWMFGRARRG
jgi:DNA-binding beta-propeller fold protein YncE